MKHCGLTIIHNPLHDDIDHYSHYAVYSLLWLIPIQFTSIEAIQ